MGAWGTKIFSDDFACDIRNDYIDYLIIGKSSEEASNEIIKANYEYVKGTEVEGVFWFALALVQWQKGRLNEYVKNKAIEFVDNGQDLVLWDTKGNEKNYIKRKQVLQELKITLLSPMPEAKKIRKPSWVYKAPWEVGDLLVYKFTDERILKENHTTDFLGRYILLRVISIFKSETNRMIASDECCVGVYGWVGDEIPDKNIVNSLEYIVIEDQEVPILGHIHERVFNVPFKKKDIKEHNIKKIDTDENYKKHLPDFFCGYDKTTSFAPAYDLYFARALEKYFTKS